MAEDIKANRASLSKRAVPVRAEGLRGSSSLFWCDRQVA